SDILASAAEKVLAVRSTWAQENPDTLAALVRAHGRAADYIEDGANRAEVCALLANRIGVAAEVVRRTLEGRLKVAPDGTARAGEAFAGRGAAGAGRAGRGAAGRASGHGGRRGQSGFLAGRARGREGRFPAGPLRRDLWAAPGIAAGRPRRPRRGVCRTA